jgi:hypothetical protein
VSDDWDPHSPDATQVHYDLSGWTFEQQAELAAELAEAEVAHAWAGDELIVGEAQESTADHVIAEVESRLGITSEGDEKAAADADGVELDPESFGDLGEDTPSTEYDLGDWSPAERRTVSRELRTADVAFRWEGATLLVAIAAEEAVDALLDEIEAGELVLSADPEEDDPQADRLPFETLTTFFLAGERLHKNTLDPDGLDDLLAAVEVVDSAQAPYGVDPRLWARTCELANELADALTANDEPDHDEAAAVARELRDLLRPYV